MSVHGASYITCDALKRWIKTLDVTPYSSVDIGGKTIELVPPYKDMISKQIEALSELADLLKDGDDWRSLEGILNPIFYNLFFRVGNNAVRVANYYECLVVPSNIRTYKRIIKGFDYQDIGAIHIYDGDTPIGTIGEKSDLIWSVFYEYFINQDELGYIEHTQMNHQNYMSIQLIDVEDMSLEEIERLVNELLLKVSMEYNLDFNVVSLDSTYKLPGEANIYELQFHSLEFEYIPALYFNNALRLSDVRMMYLSYYQVLEYFFIRAQNYNFLSQYSALSILPINHNSLHKVLQGYKNSQNERESLKLVLKKAIDVDSFKSWIEKDEMRIDKYCLSASLPIDVSKSDDKIIAGLASRIYAFRCAIAHSKGDIDEFIAVPLTNDNEILNEIELIKYVAYEALKKCSEI